MNEPHCDPRPISFEECMRKINTTPLLETRVAFVPNLTPMQMRLLERIDRVRLCANGPDALVVIIPVQHNS